MLRERVLGHPSTIPHKLLELLQGVHLRHRLGAVPQCGRHRVQLQRPPLLVEVQSAAAADAVVIDTPPRHLDRRHRRRIAVVRVRERAVPCGSFWKVDRRPRCMSRPRNRRAAGQVLPGVGAWLRGPPELLR